MVRSIARIVARGPITGLIIPYDVEAPLDGIYEVVEVMGELVVRRVGEPAQDRDRHEALSLNDLMNSRPFSCMTIEEITEAQNQQSDEMRIPKN